MEQINNTDELTDLNAVSLDVAVDDIVGNEQMLPLHYTDKDGYDQTINGTDFERDAVSIRESLEIIPNGTEITFVNEFGEHVVEWYKTKTGKYYREGTYLDELPDDDMEYGDILDDEEDFRFI